ncbi:hypothetical protein [Thioclava sp. GXIMD4215]|uniref:hypothetical protein n=1 Tax=Thioclava sp. GXIMD4215 TaxID=3131928 RepID=UPI00311AE98B
MSDVLLQLRSLAETNAFKIAQSNSLQVQSIWGPILKNYKTITSEQYRRFLDFDVNQHWTSLYRQVTPVLENDNFRVVLQALADDGLSVADRINRATEVQSMGIGTASALLCTMDGRWGVYNGTTEAALKQLGIWPTFERGLSQGEQYVVVNDILSGLAKQLGISQWELDHLMWLVISDDLDAAVKLAQTTEPGSFNALIEERSSLNLATCRFVRHTAKALKYWKNSRANLEHYLGYQRADNQNPYHNAEVVFQFVPTEDGSESLFVGAYRVIDRWLFPDEPRQHRLYSSEFGENDDHPHGRFDLERLPEFEDLVGRVIIDWGAGTRAWFQWCNSNQKTILRHVSRESELKTAYEKIAAGVKYRTKESDDRVVQVQRTIEAVALAEGCDIDALIKRLASEQGHRCKITNIPFEPTGWNAPSPDRIDSSDREYAMGKIQIVCKWVNFAKGNKPDDTFRGLMKQAADCMTTALPDLAKPSR